MARISRPLVVALTLASGCASVGQVYRAAGYDPSQSAHAVKRIAVLGWAPADRPGLAALLAAEARDLIKLRKSYLVSAAGPAARDWAEACTASREGALVLRVLASDAPAVPAAERPVALSLAAELYRCADGALLWRATSAGASRAADPSLVRLTENYVQAVGAAAQGYAAPAFVLLQGLVDALPDPALSDADLEEKIELE